jgi:hypothetical protein
MMTLEEMKNRTIYVVPQFQEDWKLMLVIEEMTLFDLANRVNRNTTYPPLYNVEERDGKWVVVKRITQQKYEYLMDFDNEVEAMDYMYGSCLYGNVIAWMYLYDKALELDYYERIELAHQHVADMLSVSKETVISLIEWKKKLTEACINRNFRYDYAHFRRTLTKDNPRKADVERIIRKLNSELIYGGDFTKGWYNHFGEDIQGKMVEDVIEMIKERKY